MEESKQPTIVCSCSNIVTWDLWMAQRGLVINDWDTKAGRTAGASLKPVPTSRLRRACTHTHRIVFVVHSASPSCSDLVSPLWVIVTHAKHMSAKQTWQSGDRRRRLIYINHVLNKRHTVPIFTQACYPKHWLNFLSPPKNKTAPVLLFALCCHLLTRCWIRLSSHCQQLLFVAMEGEEKNKTVPELAWHLF